MGVVCPVRPVMSRVSHPGTDGTLPLDSFDGGFFMP